MHPQFLMADRERTGSGVDVSSVKKYIQLLQQGFGMTRDNLSSELAVLEGTIPHGNHERRHGLFHQA
eukprot:12897770-Prorocentrum_lima.AAC.1